MSISHDKIVVWGARHCPTCETVKEELEKAGIEYAERDFEKDVGQEPIEFQRELMAAYSFMQAYPVVQIGNQAFTPEEARKELEI